MQPSRSLQQILSELDSTYQPQVDSIRQRQAAIPGQIQAEEQGLGAKQEQAFGDILGGARRRGLGFSGIPLGEQAKYTSTEYLPALARLRQSGREQAMGLEDAILGIQERRQNQGQSIYQYETSLAEQQRQFNEQQAAAQRAASVNPYAGLFGSQGGGQPQTAATAAKIQQRADKGFNFQDGGGRAISAAQYAQLKGIPFRTLLQQMASSGDAGAKQALGFVGDDFGYNSKKIGSDQNIAKLLNNLLWGVNSVSAARAPASNRAPASAIKTPVNSTLFKGTFGVR